MRPRPLIAVVGWLAAAAAATLTGLAAVHVIGDGITTSADGDVLTPQQVEQQLASATASPAADPSTGSPTTTPAVTPSDGPSSTPSSRAARKVIQTPGGTVVAECSGPVATLVSMAPAQGYGVKRADRGPDEHAEVTFEAAASKVELRVRCVNGKPIASWKQDD
ncbi:hypothetical protein ACWD4J_37500 [Streptomyces sp. NPDC002577]